MERREGLGAQIARNAVAATLGACATTLVVTPLDVVKVRMQVHVCQIDAATAASASATRNAAVLCHDPASHFRNVFDALVRIPQQHGIRALWRGVSTSLALAVPTTGLYFTFYEALLNAVPSSRAFHENGKHNTAVAPSAALLCGMSARCATAILAAPLELLRTRIQASTASSSMSSFATTEPTRVMPRFPHSSFALALRDLHALVRSADLGWRVLFRGLGPTLLRDAPFSAIYWASYEALKAESGLPRLVAALVPQSSRHRIGAPLSTDSGGESNAAGFGTYVAAGSVSGMLAAAITTPADVVKTRMQAADGQQHLRMREVINDVFRSEGISGFTRGLTARVAKVAPACAIMMGSYELIKEFWVW